MIFRTKARAEQEATIKTRKTGKKFYVEEHSNCFTLTETPPLSLKEKQRLAQKQRTQVREVALDKLVASILSACVMRG